MSAIRLGSRRAWQHGVSVAILLSLFLMLKSYGLNYAVSDENIYFYDASLMTRGLWPYRDFFFAHPPLHLVPGWLLFELAGFHYAAAKLLPVFATCVSGVCVYFLATRARGRLAAVTATGLFLFSHDLLRASSHWTGINWSVAWLSAGLLAALSGSPVAAGILFALGSCTGAYVLPGVLMVLTLTTVVRPRHGLRFATAFALVFATVNAAFWAMGGQGFIDGVYRFHWLKPSAEETALSAQLGQMLFHNFFLLASPVYLAPLVAHRAWSRVCRKPWYRGVRDMLDPTVCLESATGTWCLLFSAGYLVFLWRLPQVYHFYLLLMFPTCAVAGGLVAAWLWSAIVRGVRDRRVRVAPAMMLAGLAAGYLGYPLFEHRLDYYAAQRGRTVRYDFPPSPLPRWAQAPVQRLLWRPERMVGERYTGIQYYLWHESRVFDAASDIAEWLRQNSEPGDAIFGDSTTTPLVALLAGVPIAAHMSDTNAARFRSGITPAAEAVAQLEATFDRADGRLTWVLLCPGRGFYNVNDFRRFVDGHFRLVRQFPTAHHGTYRLLRRVPPEG